MRRLVRALPCVLVVLPFVVLAGRVLWQRRDPDYSGDAALLELAVRSAAHGHQLLGPYSRYGFFHPGPVFFYLLAPFEWCTGGAPWALPFGVEVLNAAVATILVVVVQRYASPRSVWAGAAAAATVLTYCLAVDIGLLQILWNPLQIMLPMALLLVAVAFIDGWGWPAAIALAAGTFELQTDLSTVPVALAAMVCGVVWLTIDTARARSAGPRESDPVETEVTKRRRKVPDAGPAVLAAGAVLAWLLPVLQEVTGKPGNITQLVDFFGNGSGRPGWGPATSYVGRELAVFPLRIVWSGSLTTASVRQHDGQFATSAFLLVAAALIVVARRRQSQQALRLGVTSIVGALVAVYAVASIQGPVYWYLTAWISALAVPLLLGWLLLLRDLLPVVGAVVTGCGLVLVAVVALVGGSTTPVDDNRAFPNEPLYRADTLAVWRLLSPVVAHDGGQTVVLGGDAGLSPTLAGVALDMVQADINVQVVASLVPPFDLERKAAAGRAASVLITVSQPPDGYRVVGIAPSKLLGVTTVTVSVADAPN